MNYKKFLLALCAFMMSILAASATTGPVAFYPAEGNGNDVSGNGHNATVPVLDVNNPGISYTAGKVGQAFRFAPADGTYVDFGHWWSFESFTVSMWIRDDATPMSPQSNSPPVMTLLDNYQGFDWSITYSNFANQYVYNAADGIQIYFTLAPGAWQQLSITRDGTTHVTSLYINRQFVTSQSGIGDLLVDPAFVDNLRAGADKNLNAYWRGGIDEFRIYDRALSADEVAALAVTDWDAVRDFNANTDTADQVWQYGYTETDGSGFTNYELAEHDAIAGLDAWVRTGHASDMSVTFNHTGTNLDYNQCTTQQPDVLGLFPGNDGRKTVVRWTAPSNGTYLIEGRFQNIDHATSDVAIVQNGDTTTPIYGPFSINTPDVCHSTDTSQTKTFSVSATLKAGDTIDFRVGWGDNAQYSYDGTGLAAKITPTSAPVTNTLTFSETGPTTDGGSIHFTATGPSGWAVRVQATTTPDDEGSWTDLNDGNGGGMTEDGSTGNYALDSTAYPGGDAIYLRAIAAKANQTDLKSAPLGPLSLKQATMSIFATQTSTSDPAKGLITHIGDDVTYKLTFTNSGNAPARNLRVVAFVPQYIDAQSNINTQFVASDLTMSPGSTLVPESSAGARDGYIQWNVGDLNPNFQQFVTFTVHISNKVRITEDILLPNDYHVYSTTNQPPGSVTGFDCGAANVSTRIEGPISFTAKANNTTVAPGAQFSYTLTLKNLGSTTVNHAAAMFAQPEFARFISASFSFNPAKKKPKKGPAPFAGAAKLVYVQGHSDPQVVMDVGSLSRNQVATITLAFQAQWTSPTDVPKLSTTDYAAAFLTDSAYTQFKANFNSATSDQYTPFATDFLAFIGTNANNVAFARNDSGIVDLPLQGSLDAQPLFFVAKQISDTSSKIASAGDGQEVNAVKPSEQISFMLSAANFGKSEADDVYIQDRMPDHTSFVSATLVKAVDFQPPPPAKPKKGKKPKPAAPPNVGALRVVRDSDGHHLRFAGFKLPPHVGFVVSYTVQVDSGANAPANGTLINADGIEGDSVSSIGSSSSPHTPVGLYNGGPIEVIGTVQFAQPTVRAFVPRPGVSSDLTSSANALTAIYTQNPNAAPQPDSLGNYFFGTQFYDAQRYYVHFENTGSTAATGVTLDVPLPPHTAFYRAAFVTLPKNNANGQAGYMPGTINNSPPGGWGITAPQFLSSNTTVTFTMAQLPAATASDVMVEVIPTSDGIVKAGSLIGGPPAPPATIRDSSATTTQFREAIGQMAMGKPVPLWSLGDLFGKPHEAKAVFTATQIADEQHVPQIGVIKNAPIDVTSGGTFTTTFIVYNYGDSIVRHPLLVVPMPANARFVKADWVMPTGSNPNFIIDCSACGTDPSPGTALDMFLDNLDPHTAGAITFTMQATGSIGSTVDANGWFICDFSGQVRPDPTKTTIIAPNNLLGLGLTNTIQTSFTGVALTQIMFNAGDVFLFDIGGGNIVAQGGGNIVAQGGGNLISQDGAGIVAQGGGNLIPIGTTDAATLMAHRSEIVAAGGGNIIVPQGSSIVAQGGGNIVAAGGGNIVAQGGGNIVAQGGGNIVAAGGGNVLPPSIASLFGSGPAQIVAAGGGNIVAQGGGNIVAQGGGNIVAAGGGNIVAQGGGNVLGSLGDSHMVVQLRSGSTILAGGGNIVAQGGGN